ncbi:MAG: glycosyltransferase family 2 protein [Candidatus Levybacteria bacterium]|nr:glycosyltransferase family 2 protein [Candidatus Levybacteria bacterium]
MTKLSVVISAFNEESKIKDCLESVRFADEIILVDNMSADRTVEIAQKFTSKIFKRPNNPMLNVNKNFGFTKATGDWILSLDADEEISDDLVGEIKSTLKASNAKINGYWVPRKNIIFGKWIEHTGWYPDHQLRLFRRNKGKFEEKHVHEMIKLEGKSEYLKNPMIHRNYETITQFLQKLIIYTENEATQLIKNGYELKWQDIIRFPIKEFLSRFFARKGYKDGLHGIALSILMAFYHLVIFINIWQKLGFKDISDNNLLTELEKELKNFGIEFKHWFLEVKINQTKSPIKKIIYRFLNK